MDMQTDSRFSFRDVILEELKELEDFRPYEQQIQNLNREKHRQPLTPAFDQQTKLREYQENQEWDRQKKQTVNPVSMKNLGQRENMSQLWQKRNELNKENEFGGSVPVKKEKIKNEEGIITIEEIHRRAKEKIAADLLAYERQKEKEELERAKLKGNQGQNVNFSGVDQRRQKNQEYLDNMLPAREDNYLDRMDKSKRGSQTTQWLQQRHYEQEANESQKMNEQNVDERERVGKQRAERYDSREKRNTSNSEFTKVSRDEHSQSKGIRDIQLTNRENNNYKVDLASSSPYIKDVKLNPRGTNSNYYDQEVQYQGNTKSDEIGLLQKEYYGRDLDVLEKELIEREHLRRELNRKEQEWQKHQKNQADNDKNIQDREHNEQQTKLADIAKNRLREADKNVQQLRIKQKEIQDRIMEKEKEEKRWLQEREFYENEKERDEQDMIKSIMEKDKLIEKDARRKNSIRENQSNQDRSMDQDIQKTQREQQEKQMKEQWYDDEKMKIKNILHSSRRRISQEKNIYAGHLDKNNDYERADIIRKNDKDLSSDSHDRKDELISPWRRKTSQMVENQKENRNYSPSLSLSSQHKQDNDNKIILMNRPQSQLLENREQSGSSSRELNKIVLRKLVSANEASKNKYDSQHFRVLLSTIWIDNNSLGKELWRLLQVSADQDCASKGCHNDVESSFVYSVLSILLDMQCFDNDSACRVIEGICSSEYYKKEQDFKGTHSFDQAKQRHRIMDTFSIVEGLRKSVSASQEFNPLQGLFRDTVEIRGAISERGSFLHKDSSPLKSINMSNVVTPQKQKNRNEEEEDVEDCQHCDISSENRTKSSDIKKTNSKDDKNLINQSKKQIGSKEESVYYRLFKDASMKSLKAAEQLKKLEKTLREKEEADLQKECTFKPHINKNSLRIVQRSKSQNKLSQKEISPMRQIIQNIDEARQIRQVEGSNISQMLKRNQSANKMQAGCHKPNDKPFLFVDVSISKGQSGKLSIYAGEDPKKVAEQFAQTYGLTMLAKQRLAKKLSNLVASFENKKNNS